MMDAKDNGGPAFPAQRDDGWGNRADNEGMTLRDYFAAKAMPAIIRNVEGIDLPSEELAPQVANLAYVMADAMLEARK